MSKKLKRSAVALVLAATMVFSSQGVLTAFAVGENETSTAVDVSALEPKLDKEETVVVEEPGNTDETEPPEVTEPCGITEGCTLSKDHEGECQVTPVDPPVEDENGEDETQPCTKTEGCTLENGHEGECVTEPVTPPEEENGEDETQPCEKTEGCTLPNGHEGECTVEENTEDTKETQEPSEEDAAAVQAVVEQINALPTSDDLANYEPTIELKPEDEGYQEAYQAALDAYYSQIKKDVEAARAAYDALTEEQKVAFDATILAKLTALEELIALREQADVLPETEEIDPDTFAIIKTDESLQQYKTLDEAVEAAEEGSTITLLKDCELTKGFNKTLTFTGGHKITINKQLTSNGEGWMCFGLYDPSRELTFDNVDVEWNSEVGTAPWLMLSLTGTMNVKNGAHVKFTVDSGSTGSRNAIYLNAGSSINVSNGSTFEIYGYGTAGKEGQGLQLDKAGAAKVNVTGKSTFLIDGTNRGYVNSPAIYVEDSTFTVQNCTANASNGGNFTAINSKITYYKNAGHGLSAGNVTIKKGSEFTADNNGYYGLYASSGFYVDSTSTVNVTRNSHGGDFAGLKLTAGVTNGLVEAGATVNITDNYCSGLSNNGVCEFEEGVNLTITGNNNDKGTTSNGGGIYNSGASANLALPSNAVIYNNHADTAGDDIFNNTTSTITFGKVGSDWTLEDCGDEITGWFDDSEGNRWEAHDAPYHAEEFDEFEKLTGMATITGLHTLKAAHGIEPIDPGEPGGGDWDVEHSKSKTATPLDANYESDVTLSLPSAEEQLESDVVFVLDKSTSTDIEDEALAMLEDLQGQIAQTGAKVNVGVVIFNKEANRVLELTELTEENMSRIEEAIRTTMSSGTNTHAGLLAGKAMLDSDTSVDSSRKYLVFVSDAITYMFNSGADYDPTAIAMENGAPVSSGAGTFAGPENWLAKYGDNNEPENWDTWFTQIKAQMEADKDTYYVPYAEQYQNENHISWDERAEHATSVDTALYLTNEVYQSAKNAGYHCYAMKATSNADHPWASNFMDYLANGQEVSFEDIQNDIFYLLDADSSVVDVIGYGTDNAGNEYNFDFVDNLDNLKITVGGNELDKEDIIDPQFNDPYVTSAYGFSDPASGRDGYDFVLKYYQKGQDGNSDECFVWEINVPVSNFAPVQLTYTVKLTNPQTAEGTYGEYDANGKNGSTSLYTNKEATLYPVDSNGDNGVPENFPKPTVSYTVDNGNDNPGTDPTPDPDPDPDRPSRPNRDDDDDWEPLPDAPVKDKPTTEVDVPEETETPTTEQPDKYNPETGDTTTVFAAMALAAVSLGGVVLLGRKKK